MRSAGSDREPVQAVIGFRPPSIENRQVQAAVEDHFFAAGSRCLERPPRRVEPHVDTLDKVPSHVDIVVFDEYQAVPEPWIARHLRNLLQNALPGIVSWM